MKAHILRSILATALLTATGCGSLMKNAEANKLAASRTTGHKYSDSMSKIDKKINQQLMTMVMMSGPMGSAATKNLESPLESRLNLYQLKYKGKMVPIRKTRHHGRIYNVLEKTPWKKVFIGKQISDANNKDSFAVYTITNKGKYRTVEIKALPKLQITRLSKSAWGNITVMGVGINYKDYFDVDESLKRAYISEQDQFMVMRRIEPKKAKALLEQAKAEVANTGYKTSVN